MFTKNIYIIFFIVHTFSKNMYFSLFFLSTILTAYLSAKKLENIYSRLIDRYIIPFITRGNYNPNYKKPIDAAYNVGRSLRCPVLIHVARKDEILINDKDMIGFYKAFKDRNNTAKTYFLLSDDDTNNNEYNTTHDLFFSKTNDEFSRYEQTPPLDYNEPHIFLNDKNWPRTHATVQNQIALLQKNPVTEFFSLGYSVCKTFGRLR